MGKFNFFAAAALALGLTACSSDDLSPVDGDIVAQQEAAKYTVSYAPSRVASMAMYSNGQPVQGESIVTIEDSKPLSNDVLQQASKVFIDLLPEDKDNLHALPNKEGVTDWTTNYLYVSNGNPFTLYPAYSKTASHDIIGLYYYDESGEMHEQDIFDNNAQCPWGYYKNKNGIKITIAKGYKFGFYIKAYSPRTKSWHTFYSNVSENEHECSLENHKKYGDSKACPGNGVHSASFTYGGRTFFGFEDWEFFNNKGFDLNDIVFMVDPALSVKDNPKEEDKTPEPTPTPDPDPTPDPLPDPTPSVVAGNGSVEVNFSINDRQYTSNDTKLSIHVRDTTDVTLVIPTPADYYGPVDDMQIVQKHDIAQVYNTTSTVEMNINGNIVSLTTTYNKDNITITTKGINADVLKYLRKTYNDGLTFEINSYFNTTRLDKDGNEVPLTREELKEMLDKTTISFTRTPKFYLNAFGVIDGNIVSNDCTVTPFDPSLFDDKKESDPEHGSTSYLHIWERK